MSCKNIIKKLYPTISFPLSSDIYGDPLKNTLLIDFDPAISIFDDTSSLWTDPSGQGWGRMGSKN
jgi:hypothetical protein